MITFEVKDMTCGHCASAIAAAIKAVDRSAKVEFDLRHHLVAVAPVQAESKDLIEAIVGAGYTPRQQDLASSGERVSGRRGGCCGSCH